MPKTIIAKSEEQLKKGILPEKKKAKRKKVKYKKIAFKITAFQQEALTKYCKRHKTTPVRYLKSIVNKQAAKYRSEMPPVSYVSENQLELFDSDVKVSSKKS
ncbi:MAG: hypothetical protein ACOCWC_01125 [Bacteroidota bacterium]